MTANHIPPFPVVLDLTGHAYSVLAIALSAFSETARAEAASEEQSERPSQYRVAELNAAADTADNLLKDVERQLTEAGKTLS